ncbi:MAG: hypothetical protein MK130_07550 [Puniceicoccaceae bacterium]|nr:hypothetical protein [Puniceicoccaceae bacterium]NQY40868.1 hypothetical protein [Henriciella sp.]
MSNITRRLRALERKSGGDDPLIVLVHSFADDAAKFALVFDGRSAGLRVDRELQETSDLFLHRVSKMVG